MNKLLKKKEEERLKKEEERLKKLQKE